MKGLTNIGNTCYFNACMQCLLQTPALSNYFITKSFNGGCGFTTEYSKLVRTFWLNKSDDCIDTHEIMKLFREKYSEFDNNDEQDAQECLLKILDIFHKSTRRSVDLVEIDNNEWKKKKSSFIKDLFFGQICKEIVYNGGTSLSHENFNAVMLTPRSRADLSNLLADYTSDTVLEGYTDNKGTKHHVSVMTQKISHTPSVLTFCFTMYLRKYKTRLHEKVIINNVKYVLYACCVHMGTVRGGHYCAYTKHKGEWWLKDDNISIKKAPCLTDYFYFCMYKKVS